MHDDYWDSSRCFSYVCGYYSVGGWRSRISAYKSVGALVGAAKRCMKKHGVGGCIVFVEDKDNYCFKEIKIGEGV